MCGGDEVRCDFRELDIQTLDASYGNGFMGHF